ncbi:4-(cytidine 5'-diphospho)-2-C-methyl-D-erythritol kinase [Algihabitans albus]|uniref:4-(cytidine 5'-diphospho)-2-C-methyl-D-erythritol kinase n=1 Tax=Algihabitans albus TaxID=2164067 RepID=UPI000E5D35CF|nr:4-(cytidine 5'-diphospho)-2-C-methyl-D-erythritol kinase [Algihabitans albus]
MVAYAAPAKVNLTLHLLGKRGDGYHLLDSLVVFAGIGDQLQAAPAKTLSLEESGPGAGAMGAGEDNLVLRAARLLIETCDPRTRARIRLEKRLPIAAGLGGGSSDAAAALIALNRLWDCGLHAEDLQRLAAAVGADVPVCLHGRPTWVGGIGEILEAVEALPPAWFVLVNPGVSLSTASVFRARSGGFSEPSRWDRPPADAVALATWLAEGRNDLQAAACALEPGIPAVLDALTATPACLLARMSGSGATCFGLYAVESEARQAAALLGEARPDWWIRAAPLLTDPVERG